MMKASEVKEWLKDIDDDADLAIDEGGLCLVVAGWPDTKENIYIEIGGEPLEEEVV